MQTEKSFEGLFSHVKQALFNTIYVDSQTRQEPTPYNTIHYPVVQIHPDF